MVEVKVIVNFSQLTTLLVSDINSLLPFSPIKFLTVKLKVVMPQPGVFSRADIYFCKHWKRVVFSKADIYSCKHWKKVQQIANKFWD